ncbi:hypothetical protein KKH13_04855 [Patescibacteria group bacterium]|nr:hypothetical protein [Patescibacteria group bacterium]
MPLPKQIKIGGSLYKGYHLSVASATGAYTFLILPVAKDFILSAISITPDVYGVNDNYDLLHVDNTLTSGGNIIKTLASGVYNLGAGVTVALDLSAAELVKPGESLRFVYNNVATKAMNVYLTVETIR